MNYEINKTINGKPVPIMHVSGRIEACAMMKQAMPSKSDEPDATFQEPLIYANEDSFGTKTSWESYDTLYNDPQAADHIEFITRKLLDYMSSLPMFFGGTISRLGQNYHLIPKMSSVEFENVIKAINSVFLPYIGAFPSLQYALSENLQTWKLSPRVEFNAKKLATIEEQIADNLKGIDLNCVNETNSYLSYLQNKLTCATLFGNTYGYHVSSGVIAAADHFPIEGLGFETRIHDRRLTNRNQAIVVFNQYDPKLIIGISSKYFNCIDDVYRYSLIQKSSRDPGYELGIQDISFELSCKSSPCEDNRNEFSTLFKNPEWDGAYIIPMTWYNLSKCIIELQYGNAHTKENLPLFIHNLPFYNGQYYTRGIRREELDIHADAVKQQKEMIANLSDKNFFTVKTTEESK